MPHASDAVGALGNATRPHGTLGNRVTLHLARLIVRGDLRPGQALASESQLARDLDVSKPVVRESLRELAALGLVYIRHGKRTAVQERSRWNALDPLLQDAYRLEGHGPELARQYAGVRLLLEVGSAELAARLATREQRAEIAELADELETLARTTDDLEGFLAVDRSFHDAVASASGNEVLRQVIATMHRFMARAWVDAVIGLDELDAVARVHRPIAEAIVRCDADAAAAAMQEHLADTAERLARVVAETETSRPALEPR